MDRLVDYCETEDWEENYHIGRNSRIAYSDVTRKETKRPVEDVKERPKSKSFVRKRKVDSESKEDKNNSQRYSSPSTVCYRMGAKGTLDKYTVLYSEGRPVPLKSILAKTPIPRLARSRINKKRVHFEDNDNTIA